MTSPSSSAPKSWKQRINLPGFNFKQEETTTADINSEDNEAETKLHSLLDMFMAERDRLKPKDKQEKTSDPTGNTRAKFQLSQQSTPMAARRSSSASFDNSGSQSAAPMITSAPPSLPVSHQTTTVSPNTQSNDSGEFVTPTGELMPDDIAQQIEDFLMDLSKSYQLYGCPTHIIQVNMPKVAKGLGMEVEFGVFPTHTLMAVTRQKMNGFKRKYTQYFDTSSGLDMYKLQLVDELVRRIASYATKGAPKTVSTLNQHENAAMLLSPYQYRNRRQSKESQESAAQSPKLGKLRKFLSINTKPPNDIEASTANLDIKSKKSAQLDTKDIKNQQQDGVLQSESGRKDLSEIKKKILDLSTFGPGFYHINNDLVLRPSTAKSTEISDRPAYGEFSTSQSHRATGKMRKSAKHNEQKLKHKKKKYGYVFSKIALEDGIQRLDQITKSQPLYNPFTNVILNACASGGCAGLFFNGNWWDILVSFLLGMVVAVLGLNPNQHFIRVYEFLAALVVSTLIRLVHHYWVPLCYKAVTLSSIIWLLQGVTITLSIVELLTRKLVSGTVRLFYGIMISAIIGFGLDVGTDIYSNIVGIPKAEAVTETACSNDRGISPNWYPLFLVVTTTSFNVLINSHPRQLLPMLVVSALAYLTYYYTDMAITSSNASFASFAAAFVAGLASNIYSSKTGHPALVCVMSALLLLVPGSMAVTGFFMLLQNNTADGIGLAIGMLTIAMALAIGIFTASLLVGLDDLKDWFDKSDASWREIKKSELSF